MRLAPKRQRFIEEYLRDLNATRAYRAAGYAGGDNLCATEGGKLLRNPKIAARIAAGIAARSERTRIDADWLLTRLAGEAQADLADLYDDAGNLRPVREWPLIWRQGLVIAVDSVEDGGGEVVRKVKLADRGRRLEMIGKHIDVQAFRERFEHDVAPDLAQMIAEGRRRAAEGR